MTNKKQKLELTWIGKDKRPKLEPRILLEDPSKSYHAKHKVSENDQFDNKLIFGDNLLALKALEQDYAGKVKCVFIDPPYNTGQAFDHYDDGLEHSIWLSLMRERLLLLRSLMTNDGILFCQLNDDEAAYAKVLCDEVFGRSNFLNQVSVKMKQTSGASGGGEDKKLKKNIEYILIYTKDRNCFTKFNEVLEEENLFDLIYEMRDEGKSWKYTRVITNYGQRKYLKTIQDGSGEDIKIYEHVNFEFKTIKDLMIQDGIDEESCYAKYYEHIFRDTNAQSSIRTRVMESTKDCGELLSIEYVPKSGRSKGNLTTLYYKGNNRDLIAWLKDICIKKGNKLIRLEKLGTYWDGFPLNNLTKEGGVKFPQGKKPEALVQRVVELSTSKGDIVLDSFGGSGTTGAVAHKMGRRWIMVELGEHCHTHIIPRLQKVIDGTDQGGISKAVNWQGGGGFRYYKVAPSLLEKDRWGQWIINREYNAAMLAEALCKLEGFSYAPSDTEFWNQGYSTENDRIYVTTQSLTLEQLQAISEEVGNQRTLLICCSAFRAKPDQFANLTLKKIPKMVLNKCEWAHDDYSLNVENLPMQAPDPEPAQTTQKPQKSAQKQPGLVGLFDDEAQS
ncbi:MAG: site-specific DNA-methyltransferase [Thiomicrospira sp.]